MNIFVENSSEHVGAYNKGAFARLGGVGLDCNPYSADDAYHAAWRQGWLDSGNICAEQDAQVAGNA